MLNRSFIRFTITTLVFAAAKVFAAGPAPQATSVKSPLAVTNSSVTSPAPTQNLAEPDSTANLKMKTMVVEEYQKEQQKLQNELSGHRKTLIDLENDRKLATNASIALGRKEAEGLDLFKRYIKLLKVRYTEEKTGKYEEGMAITQDDVKNINNLFDTFLKQYPLHGRVSSGEVIKLLEKGYDQLSDAVNTHNKPTVENNSELAIIAHQVVETNSQIAIVNDLASRLDVKLSQALVAQADAQAAVKTEIAKEETTPKVTDRRPTAADKAPARGGHQ